MNRDLLRQDKHRYGIDLLRIFLMIFIITGHLFTHTDVRSMLQPYSFKWFFTWGYQSFSSCAVDCFILITGYFSSLNSKLKIKKILVLWCEVLFYSSTIYLVLVLTGNVEISLREMLCAVLPVLSGQYWFFSSYILLMFLIPFINVMIGNMSDLQLKCLSIIILIVFYCLPIFSIIFVQFDPTEGMGIIGFISLYILGYAFRKFNIDFSKVKLGGVFIFNCVAVVLSKVLLTLISNKLGLLVGSGLFYHYNSIFQLLNAVILLLIFKQINCQRGTQRFLTFVSSSVFGVYLIHEHPNMRKLIWNSYLYDMLINSSAYIYVALVLILPLIIFVFCIFIDKIRIFLVCLLKKIKWCKKLSDKVNNLEKTIQSKYYEQRKDE